MPTLEQILGEGRKVQTVIAERLGLDLADGEWVRWECVRRVPRGFIGECLTEAANRE